MTSSWSLTKRKEMKDVWNIKNFGESELDSYIVNGACRECHPSYKATPIGNSYGFLMCSKRTYSNGQDLQAPVPSDKNIADYNGYHKYKPDLYSANPDVLPVQLADPYGFYDRKVPNESYLHRNDYLAREIRYDGIGVNPLRTPNNRGANGPYAEYGFAFDSQPPLKINVQHLHQKYPLWKSEMINRGVPQNVMDDFDTKYTDASTMGVW